MMRVPQEVRDMIPGDKLLRIKEVASLLKVSRSTVNRWYWEGKLLGTKLGDEVKSTIRIFKSSVTNLVEKGEM
jgi:excisionase family DNA binding protein